MNDLNLLRDLGTQLDPEHGPAAETRAHLTAAFASAPAPARRRAALVALPAAAALVAAAIGMSAVLDGGSGPAELDARSLLLAAAHTARSEAVSAPAPGDWVYTRTVENGLAFDMDGTSKPFSTVREAWLSVDGTKDGAASPSGSTDWWCFPGASTVVRRSRTGRVAG